jgi:hypothetical protein
MDNPAVTVRLDANGALTSVEIEGHTTPTILEETEPSEPIASFGDDQFRARPNPNLIPG